MYKTGRPVLVGTISIEKSELVSELLKRKGIPHHILNAKHHEKEAYIIAQAGRLGAVTIATNMAGRGTDIQLGGNFDMRLKAELEKNPEANVEELSEKIRAEIAAAKEVALKAGGLYVLGSERHESRRIDNQLRGRSGRQGDPGLSKFYVSLEDDLMRIFGSERIGRILQTMGLKQGQSIVHPWISKAIAKAQQKVESFHFDVRKNLLKYDDVTNEQRKIIYDQRRQLLESDSVHDIIGDMRRDAFESVVYSLAPERTAPEDWDAESLRQEILGLANIDVPFDSWKAEPGITPEEMVDRLCKMAEENQAKKWGELPEEARNELERSLLIQSVDQLWKEHLQSLDFMKTSIGLRAYGQKNPLNEYKHDAFLLFQNMLGRIRERVCQVMGFAELRLKQAEQPAPVPEEKLEEKSEEPPKIEAKNMDIPRNAPCPCGSGKKYKHCCGKLD